MQYGVYKVVQLEKKRSRQIDFKDQNQLNNLIIEKLPMNPEKKSNIRNQRVYEGPRLGTQI